MPGVAAGSITFTSRSGALAKPNAFATSTRSRSTERIAPWVAKYTIQNTPIEMMNTAAPWLTPNQMIANGTHARPGIGRSTRLIHANRPSATGDMPVRTPSATPAAEPANRPIV